MINEPLNLHDAEVPAISVLTIKDMPGSGNLVFIDETDSTGVSGYGRGTNIILSVRYPIKFASKTDEVRRYN